MEAEHLPLAAVNAIDAAEEVRGLPVAVLAHDLDFDEEDGGVDEHSGDGHDLLQAGW